MVGIDREKKHERLGFLFDEQGRVLCDFCRLVTGTQTIATTYLRETGKHRGTHLRFRCEDCAVSWKHSPVVKHLSVKEGIALEMAKKLAGKT